MHLRFFVDHTDTRVLQALLFCRLYRALVVDNLATKVNNCLTTTKIGTQRELSEALIFDKSGDLLGINFPEFVYALIEITDQM